jgi:hypothetical protein
MQETSRRALRLAPVATVGGRHGRAADHPARAAAGLVLMRYSFLPGIGYFHPTRPDDNNLMAVTILCAISD